MAKEFKVSTDYILGLTTVIVRKSYDISELGLSEGAVKGLVTGAVDVQKQTPLTIDDVTAIVAGQIGQLAPMDEEAAELFQQLAKKMMEQVGSTQNEEEP